MNEVDKNSISPKLGISCLSIFGLAWVVSILIIIFVVFVFVDRFNFNQYIKEPLEDRLLRFRQVVIDSKPVIDAINKYHHDRGMPPKILEDLVPDYLSEIPGTGLKYYPDYDYTRFQDNNETVALYCLEFSENNKKKGQWVFFHSKPVYITNTQGGVVLALLLNANGVIIDTTTSAVPEKLDKMAFDLDWRWFTQWLEI